VTVGLYGIDCPETAQPHESKGTSSASVKPLYQPVEV
jgi:endonuclease YncB( thermonuclease family)